MFTEKERKKLCSKTLTKTLNLLVLTVVAHLHLLQKNKNFTLKKDLQLLKDATIAEVQEKNKDLTAERDTM